MVGIFSTEIEALEADVKEKLLSIGRSIEPGRGRAFGPAPYDPDRFELRLVRGGAFRRRPMRIASPERLHRSRQFSLSPDGLAHLLSALPAHLASGMAERVREIVLLPELTLHAGCLLSHVFVPGHALLAFYLYPLRLHRPPAEAYPERFRRQDGSGAGLLPALFATLSRLDPGEENGPGKERILKFLLPQGLVRPDEIEAMQEIHDRYRSTRIG